MKINIVKLLVVMLVVSWLFCAALVSLLFQQSAVTNERPSIKVTLPKINAIDQNMEVLKETKIKSNTESPVFKEPIINCSCPNVTQNNCNPWPLPPLPEKLPKVTVASPICTARKKWFPNLYAMFKHQNYPGELELILLDGICYTAKESGAEVSSFFTEKAKIDRRISYTYIGTNNMTLGEKRNWMAMHASGDIIVNMDVDDYYAPHYVSKMVSVFNQTGADFVKLHAWFSLGERWLYDPLRRFYDFTYIDMSRDPLPWGWTYCYTKRLVLYGSRFGNLDASEEGGFFKPIPKEKIHTFADTEFLALRIVTRFHGRYTGARRCDYKPELNDHPCFQLPDFVAINGFGKQQIQPWLDMWDVSS